jgi:hypothetical protein
MYLKKEIVRFMGRVEKRSRVLFQRLFFKKSRSEGKVVETGPKGRFG